MLVVVRAVAMHMELGWWTNRWCALMSRFSKSGCVEHRVTKGTPRGFSPQIEQPFNERVVKGGQLVRVNRTNNEHRGTLPLRAVTTRQD